MDSIKGYAMKPGEKPPTAFDMLYNELEREAKEMKRWFDAAVAVLFTPRYVADLRREMMVEHCTHKYQDWRDQLVAQGQAEVNKEYIECARRRDLLAKERAERVVRAFKGVSEGQMAVWRTQLQRAGLNMPDLVALHKNAGHDWQRFMIEQEPRTTTRVVGDISYEGTVDGWSAIEDLAKEREAKDLDSVCRVYSVPPGGLNEDAIEDAVSIARGHEGRLRFLDPVGYERHICQTFHLPKPDRPKVSDFPSWLIHSICNELETIPPVVPPDGSPTGSETGAETGAEVK
jgi:hypothetical protein